MNRHLFISALAGALLLAAGCTQEDQPGRAPDGEGSDQTPSRTVADAASAVPNTATAASPTITPAPPTQIPATAKHQPTLPPAPPMSNCHPSYQGACLDPNASDYDCAGGPGNGPKYTNRVTVVGPDVFDLDRDGDGIGCE